MGEEREGGRDKRKDVEREESRKEEAIYFQMCMYACFFVILSVPCKKEEGEREKERREGREGERREERGEVKEERGRVRVERRMERKEREGRGERGGKSREDEGGKSREDEGERRERERKRERLKRVVSIFFRSSQVATN